MAKDEKEKIEMVDLEILHPIDHGVPLTEEEKKNGVKPYHTHYGRGVHRLPKALAEEFLKLTARTATPKVENEGRPDERTVQQWGDSPICRIYKGPVETAPRGEAKQIVLKETQSVV